MVQIKAFSYNSNAKYQPSGVYNTKDLDIINQTIEVKQPSDSPSGFKVKFPQIFAKYVLPYVESDAIVQNWHSGVDKAAYCVCTRKFSASTLENLS